MVGRAIGIGLFVALVRCGGIAVIDGDGDETTSREPELTPCGRADDADCGPDAYCDRPQDECVGEGVCRQRPTECASTEEGTCGCDGTVFANPCVALQHGVEPAGAGAWCPLATAARVHFDGDRMWLNHVDPLAGICTRLFADKDPVDALAVTMWSTWRTTSVVAMSDTANCLHASSATSADVTAATASGTLSLSTSDAPPYCSVDVDIVLEFPPSSWTQTPLVVLYPDAPVVSPCP